MFRAKKLRAGNKVKLMCKHCHYEECFSRGELMKLIDKEQKNSVEIERIEEEEGLFNGHYDFLYVVVFGQAHVKATLPPKCVASIV